MRFCVGTQLLGFCVSVWGDSFKAGTYRVRKDIGKSVGCCIVTQQLFVCVLDSLGVEDTEFGRIWKKSVRSCVGTQLLGFV